MKRLLELVGITYLTVLAVVFYLPKSITIAIGLFFAIALVIIVAVKKLRNIKPLRIFTFIALIACVVNVMYTTFVYEKTVDAFSDKNGTAVLTLKEKPTKTADYYTYKFDLKQFEDEECDFSVVCYYHENIKIQPYDTMKCEIQLNRTDNKNLIAKGYFFTGDLSYDQREFSVKSTDDKPFYYKVMCLRDDISDAFYSVLDEDSAALCCAVFLGDKYSLDMKIRDDFTSCGATHLIVVSGLHFSILTSLFFILACRFRRHRGYIILIAFLFILGYMMLTGFSPSVMRSGIMMIIYGGGLLLARDSDAAISLGISAIIILLCFGPYSAADVGLLLSFSSTYAIIKLSPSISYALCKKLCYPLYRYDNKFAKIMYKILRYICELLSVNLSALVASIPLCIMFFGTVSTLSLISTFALYIPIEILLFSCLLLCLFYFIPFVPFVVPVIGYIIDFTSEFIISFVHMLAQFDYAVLYITEDYVYLFVILAFILCMISLLCHSKRRVKILCVSIAIMFLSGYISSMYLKSNHASLYVYDVKEGMAVVYEDKDTTMVLNFDCTMSSAHNVIEKLHNDNTKITLYSSHNNSISAHRCLCATTEEFAIENILRYDNKRSLTYDKASSNYVELSGNYNVNLDDSYRIYYHYMDDKYALRFVTSQNTILILPDFADAKDLPDNFYENDIIIVSSYIENYELLSCDKLIVSAHGFVAQNIMFDMCKISDSVLVTDDGDINLVMEV